MKTTVRLGEPRDLEELKSIDSYYGAGFPERAAEIARWLRDGAAYVAVRETDICGYAALGKLFGRPFIEMLMIAEGSRRDGIGTHLVAHLEEWVDGPEIWTSTNLSNQPMQGLLATRNFTLTGFIDNLDPGDPELIYFKKLDE